MATTIETFNLLHPAHALFGRDFPVRGSAYSERARIDKTTALLRDLVKQRADADVLVLALQEVSAAQAAAVDALAAELGGVAARYQVARVPRVRPEKRVAGYEPEFPDEMPELEMLLVFGAPEAKADHSAGFANDTGKGYCSVAIPERSLWVASTHLSYGTRRHEQLAALSKVRAHAASRGFYNFVVAGDFNCTADALRAAWERVQGAQCVVVNPAAPTRIGKTGPGDLVGAETVDHVLVVSQQMRAHVVRVYETDVYTLSDHRPVEVVFE